MSGRPATAAPRQRWQHCPMAPLPIPSLPLRRVPAPGGAPARHRLGARWLLVAAGVLGLHLVLLQGLLPPARPTGLGPGEARRHAAPVQVQVQVRALVPPLASPPAMAAVAAVEAAPAPARLHPPAVLPMPALAPAEAARPMPTDVAPAQAAVAAVGAAVADSDAPPPASDDGGPGEPPPVYATRLPEPAQLRYALTYNGQAGEAVLTWHHDGRHFSLSLDGIGSGNGAVRPLVVQASRGAVDAAGLAPERFVDRRRGGRSQAANFQRERGRIGFSGPATEHPAWPGAQDRLSWLVQLAAIRAAGEAGPEIRLFVADARGSAGLWRLQRQPDEALAGPDGDRMVEVWRRDPPRPEGLRVEAWLDPARSHWPVQLRFTAQRSGDVFGLRLLAGPLPPPATP